ncbi:MAG: two-component sensor histidine kinase [Gemmatimonadetes bacterium]|nr:two-component sensor histidine kinase [Gemmatimonadota bacterium]
MRALSLRTKVFILFSGAMLLIVVPVLVLIKKAVDREVYRRATDDISRAAKALERNWQLRDSLLLSEATKRAGSRDLVRAWGEADAGRIRRVLKRGLDADQEAIAVDTAGLVIVGPDVGTSMLRTARASPFGGVAFLDAAGHPTRVALAPVVSDSGVVVGVVGVGTRLSSATVHDLKKDIAVGTDIALAVGDSLVGTTFPDSIGRSVRWLDLATVLRTPGIWKQLVGGRPYMSRVVPLPTGGLSASAVLFRPIAEELTLSQSIVQSTVGIGLAALLVALILALVVARIVARPLQALVQAAARLAQGDYNAPLPRVSGDEIGRLAQAFGDMRQAIGQREARLRSAQAEMIHREKLAAMGRLVAQLSHEINNPIYNIQNCLEALERRGDPRDPNREFVELAQEELARMATLTRQLLDQSRPLSDAATPLQLNSIVGRVLTLAAPELQQRGIAVETELARELPAVVAHPDAIQQVLANLVANARDAMGEGDRLRVVTRADADAVEVVVEDTGCGIAEQHLPHIFEAFYTTKPGVQGIGLGLFVSEGIIRGHRGRLSVESRPAEGSRFTIRLPRETLDESVESTAVGAEHQPA